MAVFLIVGISGCTDTNSGSKSGILGSLSKSSVSSKLAASQNSGMFSEKAYPYTYGPCKGLLDTYRAVYNNGDTLEIKWMNEARNTCDNKFFSITYDIKKPASYNEFAQNNDDYTYDYRMVFAGGQPRYSTDNSGIEWTADGRVDPSRSKGDINEANEFINLGKAKANEIVNRFYSKGSSDFGIGTESRTSSTPPTSANKEPPFGMVDNWNDKTLESKITLPSYAYTNSITLKAYQYATEHPDVLEQIPCYCGCGGHSGHRFLRDCFIKDDMTYDEHGSFCDICIGEAIKVQAYLASGKTLREARTLIDEEYSKIGGDRTNTPPVS